MSKTTKAETKRPVSLKINKSLWDRLIAEAKANRYTLTTQLEIALEERYKVQPNA